MSKLRRTGPWISELVVAGGGSKADTIMSGWKTRFAPRGFVQWFDGISRSADVFRDGGKGESRETRRSDDVTPNRFTGHPVSAVVIGPNDVTPPTTKST
jgi:hypothetical protein